MWVFTTVQAYDEDLEFQDATFANEGLTTTISHSYEGSYTSTEAFGTRISIGHSESSDKGEFYWDKGTEDTKITSSFFNTNSYSSSYAEFIGGGATYMSVTGFFFGTFSASGSMESLFDSDGTTFHTVGTTFNSVQTDIDQDIYKVKENSSDAETLITDYHYNSTITNSSSVDSMTVLSNTTHTGISRIFPTTVFTTVTEFGTSTMQTTVAEPVLSTTSATFGTSTYYYLDYSSRQLDATITTTGTFTRQQKTLGTYSNTFKYSPAIIATVYIPDGDIGYYIEETPTESKIGFLTNIAVSFDTPITLTFRDDFRHSFWYTNLTVSTDDPNVQPQNHFQTQWVGTTETFIDQASYKTIDVPTARQQLLATRVLEVSTAQILDQYTSRSQAMINSFSASHNFYSLIPITSTRNSYKTCEILTTTTFKENMLVVDYGMIPLTCRTTTLKSTLSSTLTYNSASEGLLSIIYYSQNASLTHTGTTAVSRWSTGAFPLLILNVNQGNNYIFPVNAQGIGGIQTAGALPQVYKALTVNFGSKIAKADYAIPEAQALIMMNNISAFFSPAKDIIEFFGESYAGGGSNFLAYEGSFLSTDSINSLRATLQANFLTTSLRDDKTVIITDKDTIEFGLISAEGREEGTGHNLYPLSNALAIPDYFGGIPIVPDKNVTRIALPGYRRITSNYSAGNSVSVIRIVTEQTGNKEEINGYLVAEEDLVIGIATTRTGAGGYGIYILDKFYQGYHYGALGEDWYNQ